MTIQFWLALAASLVIAGGAGIITTLAFRKLYESTTRLRASEHRQSGLLHIIINLLFMIAKKIGVDTQPIEKAMEEHNRSLTEAMKEQ